MQWYFQIFDFSKAIKRGVGFSWSAPPSRFIFIDRFLSSQKKKKSRKVISMFCSWHFSLKCILKNNYYCHYIPLKFITKLKWLIYYLYPFHWLNLKLKTIYGLKIYSWMRFLILTSRKSLVLARPNFSRCWCHHNRAA